MNKVSLDVDRAFCISLSAREDRRALFGRTVATRIANQIEFLLVECCSDPIRGCYESHQALAKRVLAENWQRILIFEDDAQPYDICPTQIRWINLFLRTRRFHALHLGYTVGQVWLTWFPFIARGRVVALHAYIISREACQILAETPYCGKPVDVLFKQRLKQHCVFPMLYRQYAAAVTGSDIQEIPMNEDGWWERNWKKHWRSMWRNMWRTVLRIGF